MNAVFDYINQIPVPVSTKWVLLVMCISDRHIFTQQSLVNLAGLKNKRIVRDHLYKLIDAGVISSRNPKHHKHWHYWITDIRLIRHINAA